VKLLSDNVAVATYTFRWSAAGVMAGLAGKRTDKAVRNGRATEVIASISKAVYALCISITPNIWRMQSRALKGRGHMQL